MNYKEAWAFLDNLQFFKIKLGLDSMSMFLDELGRPQDRVKCIHIAGTNGKGSVAVTLQTLLAKAGYRVGLYTSPHLHSVRERFVINGSCISHEQFAEEATRIKDILDGRQITYFEFTTALALLWFESQAVDIAIMEVGLGGRLDATNVITPLVSIITNISMDHEAYLGDTIEQVAYEKAGIIKSNVPVVCGVENNEFDMKGQALKIIEDTCSTIKTVLYLHGRDFFAEQNEDRTWNYWGMKRRGCCQLRETVKNLQCHLLGDHQVQNAALSLAALDLLEPQGFTVDEATIRSGLQEVKWPGRLEYFCLSKINGEKVACDSQKAIRYLLDGAHNPAGVAGLIKALQNDFLYRRLILVWGAMEDKDLASTLLAILPFASQVILTKQESERSATTAQLQAVVPSMFHEKTISLPDVAVALKKAAELATKDDLICVAGSLYLIGAVRDILLGSLE